MAYDFVPFDYDRLSEVLDLERTLWSQDAEANAAYFAWKYEQNPFLDRLHMYLALAGDEVVGVRGFHGTAWRVDENGSTVVTPTGGDTVVVPEHRNRFLFEKINSYSLSQLEREGVKMVCNFSGGPVTYLRSLRAGWRTLGAYLPLARDRTQGDGVRSHADAGGVEVEEAPRSDAMVDLVEHLEDPSAIRLNKDRAFFEWRFRNPLSRYVFLYADEGGALSGYMVLQRRLLKRARGMRIVDWEAADDQTFGRLLSAAISEVDTERLTIWSATLPPAAQARFEAAGFRAVDDTKGSRHYRPGPLVAAIGSDPSEPWRLGSHAITDLQNWRLRLACSDSF